MCVCVRFQGEASEEISKDQLHDPKGEEVIFLTRKKYFFSISLILHLYEMTDVR